MTECATSGPENETPLKSRSGRQGEPFRRNVRARLRGRRAGYGRAIFPQVAVRAHEFPNQLLGGGR